MSGGSRSLIAPRSEMSPEYATHRPFVSAAAISAYSCGEARMTLSSASDRSEK